MRRRRLTTLLLCGGLGAVVGASVGVIAHFAASSSVRTTFGWYSYTAPPRRYADYLPAQPPRTDWVGLLSTSIGVGLGVGVVLGLITLLSGRTLALQRAKAQ